MIPGTERPIHTVINHILPPKGPAGRHGPAAHVNIGIWKWSKAQELAKEFFEWHFERDSSRKSSSPPAWGTINRSSGPFSMHPIYASNPKFYFAPYMSSYIHAIGWPGVPTAAAQAVADQYIVPDAAATHATGRATAEEATKKAEFQDQENLPPSYVTARRDTRRGGPALTTRASARPEARSGKAGHRPAFAIPDWLPTRHSGRRPAHPAHVPAGTTCRVSECSALTHS